MQSKIVNVGYTLLTNKPNNRKIEKTINKWGNKGYKLQQRQDKDVGCLSQLYFGRGETILTFIKE